MNTFAQQRSKLRVWLAIIFTALATPSVALLVRSFNQLQYESFYLQRSLAESFATDAQTRFSQWMESEEQRPTTDYAFLVISGETYVQRSPLAALTPTTNAPGVVGFFQVDEAGSFATPLLPNTTNDVEELKLTTQEHRDRLAKQNQIRDQWIPPLVSKVASKTVPMPIQLQLQRTRCGAHNGRHWSRQEKIKMSRYCGGI